MTKHFPEIFIGIALIGNLGLLALTGKDEFYIVSQILAMAGLILSRLKEQVNL